MTLQFIAWECAHALRDHYDRIPLPLLVTIEVAYLTGPFKLSPEEAYEVLAIYDEVMGERV